MIAPELLQIRQDICKKCRTKCDDYLADRIEHHNPCARCPLAIWHHIDGVDCSSVLPPVIHPTCPEVAVQISGNAGGPGTELKAMLAKVGIVPTPTCSCNDRAAEMDRQGPDWCEAHIDTIVDWMAQEAKRRGLPMPRMIGLHLVKSAIRKARRATLSAPLHLSKM